MAAGIHHLEFWVSDLSRSFPFYQGLFQRIGWTQLNHFSFATKTCDFYLVEKPGMVRQDAVGVRHVCFQAEDEAMVQAVGAYLQEIGADIIRGPVKRDYSEGYFTVDFRDPDGYVLEVAYTPHHAFAP
jgi:catechol 2,3-dioxygenase-like lactoylglutathione lyase family enzyme